MFRLIPLSAQHYDCFRTVFGLYIATLMGLLLGDRSLAAYHGSLFTFTVILGVLAGLSWAFAFHRRFAAIVYLACLAVVVEWSPSAMRVVPGYIGWFMLMSLAVPKGEGCRLRGLAARPDWAMPASLHVAMVVVLTFSFTFSGMTKAISPIWYEGRAFDVFAENVRFSWSSTLVKEMPTWARLSMTYLTVAIEVLFMPLYFLRPTRGPALLSIFFLFGGILLMMKIYVVAVGIILSLVPLFKSRKWYIC